MSSKTVRNNWLAVTTETVVESDTFKIEILRSYDVDRRLEPVFDEFH